MPRWLRIILTGLSFAIFFGGAFFLGVVLAPVLLILALGSRRRQRQVCTWCIGRGYGAFLLWMKCCGLIGYHRVKPPAEVAGSPHVVVANHPSLIDVVFLLNWFRGLTCVVKSSSYRSWFFGSLLRSTHYLPGPGYERDRESAEAAPVLDRMVEHLQSGHPLLIFPEGTRSRADELHRFRRGAFEAARRAGVPIVPVFIGVDRPFLMKGQPFWHVPPGRVGYHLEVLPTLDPSTFRSGKELRDAVEAQLAARFEQWVEARSRHALPSLASSAPAHGADRPQASSGLSGNLRSAGTTEPPGAA